MECPSKAPAVSFQKTPLGKLFNKSFAPGSFCASVCTLFSHEYMIRIGSVASLSTAEKNDVSGRA